MLQKLTNILSDYFSIGDSYHYVLNRVKTAFGMGTMTLSDFEEYSEEIVEEIAEHLIENGVTVQRWIPVTERLPEAERIAWTKKHPDTALKVLAIIQGSDQAAELWYSGIFEGKPSFWALSYNGESTVSYAVTHWMPMPKLP